MTREQIMARCKELDPIWQYIKDGKKFKLWDNNSKDFSIAYITGIDFSDKSPYKTVNNSYRNAVPIEPLTRVKQPIPLMQALIDGGYKHTNKKYFTDGTNGFVFNIDMFSCCGELESENKYNWRPEWLEEVYE